MYIESNYKKSVITKHFCNLCLESYEHEGICELENYSTCNPCYDMVSNTEYEEFII